MIRDACRFVKDLYGRQPASEFGPLALKSVRERMIDAGHSQKSINKNVGRIRRMFKWAVGEELIPTSVHLALSTVTGLKEGRTRAKETDPTRPVDPKIIEATLEQLPAVVADMVRFQVATGCRPEEVCMLRPTDIDRTGDVWQYRPESHKTQHHGKERIIFIGPNAQNVLLRYLARDLSAYCFRPCDSEEKRRAARRAARKTPLSCGNRLGSNRRTSPKRTPGEKYETGSYGRAIQRACDKAFLWPKLAGRKIKELTDDELVEFETWRKKHRWAPNRLRHTMATEVRRTYGVEASQVVLGHSKADVTQVYAERDFELAARVAREVG